MTTPTEPDVQPPHLTLLPAPSDRSSADPAAEPDDRPAYCFDGTHDVDHEAWELLVRRYEPYLMRLAASYHLGDEAHDAVQETFIRLVQHGGGIRKPQSLKYWLATVLRHECLKVIARRRREHPVDADNMDALLPPAEHTELDHALLREEDAVVVRAALAQLPARQREVMTLLADPDTDGYRALADVLGMPVGSIGPTRQRAIVRLRETLTAMSYDRAS